MKKRSKKQRFKLMLGLNTLQDLVIQLNEDLYETIGNIHDATQEIRAFSKENKLKLHECDGLIYAGNISSNALDEIVDAIESQLEELRIEADNQAV